MKLRELIRSTARRFAAARLHYGHGTQNARDEAAFLVLRSLALPFGADPSLEVDEARVEPLIRKRIEERIPVAYLLKEAWLAGRKFYVDRRVIIPRSHIAFLLDAKLEPWLRRRPARMLDLCTGSGCLAIIAAQAFPQARVEASDLSAAALVVARRNVAAHRLQSRIRLVKSDLLSALSGPYDVIVTNPPYVPTRSMRRLPAEYRYEPGMALGAGREGLDIVKRIVRDAARHLAPRGLLVCEVGEARRALEKAMPLRFTWTGESVFLLERERLSR
ncbi:MAG: 50S ribosomal protein L3 N(5)-glutamine methyltransferase [Betaproteobacteria bacterium]